MDSGGEIDTQALEFQNLEGVFEDRDVAFLIHFVFWPFSPTENQSRIFSGTGNSLTWCIPVPFLQFLPRRNTKFPRIY